MNHPVAPVPAHDTLPDAAIDLVIRPRLRDIGAFNVRRSLPAVERRLVGPFAFFDHMGPAVLDPNHPMTVRPHPHIGLATVTYLFEGEIMHRDSLGSAQIIRPGDVNWMVAGRGIVHSERGTDVQREKASPLHGIQLWLGLPTALEETEPKFVHHPAKSLPTVTLSGVFLRIILGQAYGATSPVEVLSPMHYVEATLESNAELLIPNEHEERAAYVVEGSISVEDETIEAGVMVVFRSRVEVKIHAIEAARVMLLGGEPLDGDRHIYWNFVSSSKDRIEQAKADWREGRFPKVPGDEVDFIPLPE
jgi:redox-sensitive bicupin YhaK (pirin superfamily)